MYKPSAFLLVFLIFTLALFWNGGLEKNLEGLRAMRYCVGTDNLPALEKPFFQGGVFRCSQNTAEMRQAYQKALQEPNARLEIIRGILPFDVELAQMAVQSHSNQAVAYFWLAEALRAEGELITAIPNYEKGLELDPTQGDEWDNLGRLYEANGDLPQAVLAFDQACHYIDQGKNGCPNAARLYLQLGQIDQAIVRFEDTLVQLPGYPLALRGLADAWISLGKPEKAIPYLEALATQGDVEAQNQLEQLQPAP